MHTSRLYYSCSKVLFVLNLPCCRFHLFQPRPSDLQEKTTRWGLEEETDVPGSVADVRGISMATSWRHFKRNWKVYGGFLGTWLVSRWAAKRYRYAYFILKTFLIFKSFFCHRESTITRAYCMEAKVSVVF